MSSSRKLSMVRPVALFLAGVLALGCAGAQRGAVSSSQPASAPTSQPEKRLVVRTFSLNPYVAKLDGQWQAMRLGSDGKVYFASSSHSHDHGAAYFRYDGATDKLTMLCEDISKVCGEDPTSQIPQGKIHSDSVESKGHIYFATHLANYWPAANSAYSGAHLIRLDMRDGTLRDMGIFMKGHTCYSALAIDPQGRWAYALAVSWAPESKGEGTFIVRCDLATGKMQNLGAIPLLKHKLACPYFFVDSQGDCWFPAEGRLFVARASGKIEATQTLEAVPCFDERGAMKTAAADGLNWGQGVGDGRRFLCTLSGDNDVRQMLYEFDARRAAAGKPAFTPVARIGFSGLGMTRAADRVYFVQLGSGKPGAKGENHHFLSVAWRGRHAGQVIDHGRIFDQDGRTPWRIESMAADGKGKVYMSGDWRLLKNDKGEVLESEALHATLRLPEDYKGVPPATYSRLWRGQFFGVVDVGK
jgi:hypothetical protein